MVGIYNEALARGIERMERPLIGTGDGQDESSLTIDLAPLIETFQVSAGQQVAYLVDTAKSEALNVLGEARQAWELVD